MDEHVNIKFFLELDNLVDFLFDGLNITLLRDPKKRRGVMRA